MKVLLHPFRPELGGNWLNTALFAKVVEELADDSKRYGWRTAIRAWMDSQAACQRRSHAFPTAGTFEKKTGDAPLPFLQRLEESWKSAPICATVAIKVSQKYFVDLYGDDPQEAAEQILRFMPCWCDATTPSRMTAILTRGDWELRRTFYD